MNAEHFGTFVRVPDRGEGGSAEPYAPLPTFKKTGEIQMRLGEETSEQLHERLWPQIERSFLVVTTNTEVVTETNYTTDISSVLNIPNVVAIFTSTCKHEPPYKIMSLPLTSEQKRAIYDFAPF